MKDTLKSIVVGIGLGIIAAGFLANAKSINNVAFELRQIRNEVREMAIENKVDGVLLTATCYTARKQETNNDPVHTATMRKPVVGSTVAVSRDLIHWLGGSVYIEGLGVRRVDDLMNSRFTNKLDILVGSVKEARAFGVQEKKVIFLGR